MVTLRSTAGRKAATLVGTTSAPVKVTAPLTRRIGVGSQQYPSIGTAVTVRLRLSQLPDSCSPFSGISIWG